VLDVQTPLCTKGVEQALSPGQPQVKEQSPSHGHHMTTGAPLTMWLRHIASGVPVIKEHGKIKKNKNKVKTL